MNCSFVTKHIQSFVDAELEPSSSLDLEAHHATCESCQERLAFEQSFKSSLKVALPHAQTPFELRNRIFQAALRGKPFAASAEGPTWAGRQPTFWFAAAAAIALVSAGVIVRSTSERNAVQQASVMPVFEDVVRIHSRSLPTEVKGPRFQDVSSWFRDKVEFPVRPMDFGDQQVELLGARLSNVRESQAATLYYRVQGRRVTVVVFVPANSMKQGAQRWRGKGGRELYYRNVRGYVVPVVQHEGVTYAITGDLDPQTQLRLAARAKVHY